MSWRQLRQWLSELARRRQDLVGINRRNVTLVYPHNERRHFPIADDKLLAKEHFARAGVPVAKTLAVCEGLFAVRDTVQLLEAQEQFVVKPASGSGGNGILGVGQSLGPGRWRRAGDRELTSRELEKHLADVIFGAFSNAMEDKAFIEERVFPHPFFSTLWGDGLCDIRGITLRGEPLMAMVRVPTAESDGKANLHQGGLGISVDLATGRSNRALHRGVAIERHPETGQALLDLEIQNVNGQGLGPAVRKVAA